MQAVFLVALMLSKNLMAASSEQLRIITTNDIHFYLKPLYYRYLDEIKPWGPQSREGDYVAKAGIEGKVGGMAYVASVIKRLRAEVKGQALVLDGGDTWHGSALSMFDGGKSMVKIMNTIGYDAMVPGNWEFYYDKEHLEGLIDQSEFAVVAYNVTDREWDEGVMDPYVIKKVGNLKIAIVGFTYPWTALTSAADGAAKWWKFGIREDAAKELIAEINAEEKPDLIIMLAHGGYGLDQKFVRRVGGMDVMVSAHTHDEVYDPMVWNNAIIFQGGAMGKYVSSLDVEVKDGKIANFGYQMVKVVQEREKPDAEISKLIEEAYAPHKEKLGRVIGKTEVMLYRRAYWQSPLGNMLTDALRERFETDIAFFPAWRYGATLMPGVITAEDVYNIVPTRGTVATYRMRGKEIRRLLENILGGVADPDPYSRVGGDMIRFSGLKIVYDLSAPDDKRIASITVNGKPFSDETVYSIASAHTRFHTNPLFQALDINETEKIFVEEIMSYIETHSPIKNMLDDRMQTVRRR